MKAHKFVNGKHTLKSMAFIKATVAYSHITIPSL